MKRKILSIAAIALFSIGLTVLANSVFEIDDAFFVDTGISSGDYSPLHFNFDGNNFDGIVFWGNDSTNTGELTIGTDTISCDKQLKGLYLNTARGNKIWPLDQETLNELSGSSNFSGYDSLTMTGGFFTECTGNAGTLGYTISSDEIYGYIEHEYNSETYKLRAGVDYDFGAGIATGEFAGTLKYISGSLNDSSSGYLFDTYGGIARVYSNLDLYSNIVFTGSEVFLSGSDHYATGTLIHVNIYSNIDAEFEISGDVENIVTGNLSAGINLDKNIILTNGNGIKNIVLTVDDGSNIDTDNINVTLNVPVTADTTPPVVILSYPSNGLTATTNSINFQWSATDNIAVSTYNLYINGSGNFSRTNLTNNSQIISPLINGNYTRYVIASDSSGNTGQSATYSLTVASSYTGPTLVSPVAGANIELGDLLLSRTDTSTSGYTWQIATDTSFANIVASGETTTTTSIDPIHRPDFMTGTFYWRIINDQNAGVSDYRLVNIIEPNGGIDLEVDEFNFDNKDDARLSESYNSNNIDIVGITDHVYILAKLEDNIGALFINGIMVGSEGRVKDGDEVYIELLSSNDYDERTSATLIVGEDSDEVSDIFRIYTIQEEDNDEFELSYGQKLQAIILLDTLIEMYDDNPEKLSQFLTTFKAVLKDRSDVLEDDINNAYSDNELELLKGQKASVDYLYDIIDSYIRDVPRESTSVYIAPNGKQYIVSYDTDRYAYTSPDFIYTKYFPTWNLFTSHIDINNPGSYDAGNYHEIDDGIGEAVIAPNNKVYHVYQINGKWTSDEFTYRKYFDTREQIINYIFVNNPSETWNHKIDTSFAPVYFTAPNNRKYTIFKTSSLGANPNKYSSFGFVTPKYFNSLQAAKDHIAEYNR